MLLGNKVVVETIQRIEQGKVQALEQDTMEQGELKPAPKISKEFCRIDWSKDVQSIYNHIRGLSPYPAAHTMLVSEKGEQIEMKVFVTEMEFCTPREEVGTVHTDNKTHLKVAVRDGYLLLTEVQQAGKKRMGIADFLRGTQLTGNWKALF